MAEHNITGFEGERAAARYLQHKGYKVLEMNWRYLNTELDIVSEKDGLLVVTEVKTRTSADFGEPEIAVNTRKQKNLVTAANAYVIQNNLDMEVRFDIISVLLGGVTPEIRHIEDAFYPSL
jgi:putative endonuclease